MIFHTRRKIENGFATYERNTGAKHPLATGIEGTGKRNTGGDPLTDYHARLWYGTISVGTPAVSFTGEMFLLPGRCHDLNISLVQWTLIPAAATSSCPRQAVDQAA
jgi:hypothetical protein